MTRLTWDERTQYSGVDRGVVYSKDGLAVVWNGLIAVGEKPTDIRERVRYRDGLRIINHRAEDSLSATVDCFTYPDIVSDFRLPFHLTYRVIKNAGYEIHLIYNALPRFTGVQYAQHEASPISFDISTKPVATKLEYAPTAHVIIDTTRAYSGAVSAFETLLYGDDDTDPRLPSVEETVDIFDINALYQVIDNGDGTFTLDAPDDVFEFLSATEFAAEWPSATYLDEDTYVVRNW